MKKKAYIRYYRKEIDLHRPLTDAEFRLYLYYRVHADWDTRHVETFGSIKNPLREILAETQWPRWSLGKISYVRRGLIKKGLIRSDKKLFTVVEDMWIFQTTWDKAERALNMIERGIHPTEQDVQRAEQEQIERIAKIRQDLTNRFDMKNLKKLK